MHNDGYFDAQVQCIQNAATHLMPGGCFVVEVMVPALQRIPAGETHHVSDHDPCQHPTNI